MEEPPEYRRTQTIRAPKLLRIFFSCPLNELSREYFAELIHTVCPGSAVAIVIPPTVREEELLETATKQKFDVAILMLNNIFYWPHDLDTRLATLAADGVALVRKMKCLIPMPVIALYGWPRSARHAAILVRAGATIAFQHPFNHEGMKEALRRSLRGSSA